MAGRYCVARLAADAVMPSGFFDGDGFVSATRTGDELSLLYPEDRDVDVQSCEAGWVGFMVEGPLEFSEIGILSRLSAALADAGISLFAISTFDTDYLFVKAECEDETRQALSKVCSVLG